MAPQHQAVIEELFSSYKHKALDAFRGIVAEAKADGTAITRVDRETSALVVETLKRHTPEYGIVSEEEAEPYRPDAEWQWVIDPLDGTASFSRGYPVWGLGIGLMRRGVPREGYLCFPAVQEEYAFDGESLRFNGAAVSPPDMSHLPDTRNYLVDSSLHKTVSHYALFREVKLRIFGSSLYHMVCVAMGRAEAMIGGRNFLWDLAAALPMTRARGLAERYIDGAPLDLSALGPHNRYRLARPFVIAPPDRIEALLASIREATSAA